MFKRDIVAAFEKVSDQWITDFEVYSDELLYHKSSENEWCLAELYDHIMRVARTYQIPNFYKCINGVPESGKPKNAKGYLIFNLNILPYRKIRMQSFPQNIVTDFTPQIRKRTELYADFEDFRKEVIQVSRELETVDYTIKNRHPFFGAINARDWFALIEIHMRHHHPQKKRLENTTV